MPRFSKQEKEKIKQDLKDKGKQLFTVFGLKKTSVADLTTAVGVAQGTFYLFYPSKEELYFELLEEEEQAVRRYLSAAYLQTDSPMTRERFRRFLRESLRMLEENAFLQQLYDEELVESLFRKLPPETLERHYGDDYDELYPFLAEGQRQGWMRNGSPDAMVSLIRSFVLFSLQKKRIGEAHYEQTMGLLIELMAEGLIIEADRRENG